MSLSLFFLFKYKFQSHKVDGRKNTLFAWLQVGLGNLSNIHESAPEMYVLCLLDLLRTEWQLIQDIYRLKKKNPIFFTCFLAL